MPDSNVGTDSLNDSELLDFNSDANGVADPDTLDDADSVASGVNITKVSVLLSTVGICDPAESETNVLAAAAIATPDDVSPALVSVLPTLAENGNAVEE